MNEGYTLWLSFLHDHIQEFKWSADDSMIKSSAAKAPEICTTEREYNINFQTMWLYMRCLNE